MNSRSVRLSLCCAVLSIGLAAPALPKDVAGSKDHPLVGRYQGSEIEFYKQSDFDQATVLQAPFDYAAFDAKQPPDGPEWLALEGRVTLIRYDEPNDRSPLEILRNLQASLKAKGFDIQFECADAQCFTGNLRDPYLLGWAIDGAQQNHRYAGHARYTLAKLTRPSGDIYVSLLLGEAGDNRTAFVKIVETKGMETGKIVFVDAGAMAKSLSTAGRVALYGILFDFDKDTLRPESKPTLDEIAKLLKTSPGLKLVVAGHTDNQGGFDYNVDLSRRRAASVIAALGSQYAIGRDRLTAFGAGMAAPVATNGSEDGRSKNRRVELVER